MAGGIEKLQSDIDPVAFDYTDAVRRVLPTGHVIHGYSSAANERVIKILKTRRYSDGEPLLGFGVDGTAERALGRSLLTYAMREQLGLEFITPRQFPETDQAQIVMGRNNSRFDNIVWGGDFTLFQDGDEAVARSSYGGGYGMSPLEVRAPDALSAIVLLADTYEFMNDRVSRLPAISME